MIHSSAFARVFVNKRSWRIACHNTYKRTDGHPCEFAHGFAPSKLDWISCYKIYNWRVAHLCECARVYAGQMMTESFCCKPCREMSEACCEIAGASLAPTTQGTYESRTYRKMFRLEWGRAQEDQMKKQRWILGRHQHLRMAAHCPKHQRWNQPELHLDHNQHQWLHNQLLCQLCRSRCWWRCLSYPRTGPSHPQSKGNHASETLKTIKSTMARKLRMQYQRCLDRRSFIHFSSHFLNWKWVFPFY